MLHLPRACVRGLKVHEQASMKTQLQVCADFLALGAWQWAHGATTSAHKALPAEPALILPSCRSCCIPGFPWRTLQSRRQSCQAHLL